MFLKIYRVYKEEPIYNYIHILHKQMMDFDVNRKKKIEEKKCMINLFESIKPQELKEWVVNNRCKGRTCEPEELWEDLRDDNCPIVIMHSLKNCKKVDFKHWLEYHNIDLEYFEDEDCSDIKLLNYQTNNE
jgi:hypothetical protein